MTGKKSPINSSVPKQSAFEYSSSNFTANIVPEAGSDFKSNRHRVEGTDNQLGNTVFYIELDTHQCWVSYLKPDWVTDQLITEIGIIIDERC